MPKQLLNAIILILLLTSSGIAENDSSILRDGLQSEGIYFGKVSEGILNGEKVYLVEKFTEVYILNYWPQTMESIVTVDAAMNTVISEDKPWWSFLAWETQKKMPATTTSTTSTTNPVGCSLCKTSEYCEDELCKPYICNDTDGGSNMSEFGYVLVYQHVYKQFSKDRDSCENISFLNELTCSQDQDKKISTTLYCGVGRYCESGRCLDYYCNDTNNDTPSYVGDVTYPLMGQNKTITLTDICINISNKISYGCSTDFGHTVENISCAGGFCMDGSCRDRYCNDTDNGVNLTYRGSLTYTNQSVGLNQTFTDECFNNTFIREYRCSENGNGYLDGSLSCGENGYCTAGVCREYYCLDPDGSDPDQKNKAYYLDPSTNQEKTLWDECVGSNEVYEAICIEGIAEYTHLNCSFGRFCKDGRCAPAICADIDAGRNTTISAYAEFWDTNWNRTVRQYDQCANSTHITEAYCSDNNLSIKTELMQCPENHYCAEGACKRYTCTDQDLENTSQRASITYINKTTNTLVKSYDLCRTVHVLMEGICLDQEPSIKDIECGENQYCMDGRCQNALCIEYDGGINPTNYSNMTIFQYLDNRTYQAFDRCENLTTLTEYGCAPNNRTFDRKSLDCGKGSFCMAGRCQPYDCQDPDGMDYSIGTTVVYISRINQMQVKLMDGCIGNKTVNEAVCQQGSATYVQIDCVNASCQDGACIGD